MSSQLINGTDIVTEVSGLHQDCVDGSRNINGGMHVGAELLNRQHSMLQLSLDPRLMHIEVCFLREIFSVHINRKCNC